MNHLLPKVRGIYRHNVALPNWFGLDGKAEILFRPSDLADLQAFLKQRSREIPLTVLGAASNVIIHDEGIKGVVIKLPASFASITQKDETISAGAAALCGNVALYSKNCALTNLEFLTGIPGSIGGALAMNAGCYESDISQVLISAKAVDFDGNLFDLTNSDFGFFYRGNKIAKKFIFVEAAFRGARSDTEVIARKISELNQKRENIQPIRTKTGGSTFKNPNPLDRNAKKAWQLIDEAGCRGMLCGDAQVSEKHCNFMVNKGKASAKNLIDLGEKVQKSVKEKSGVELEWEIKILQ